MLVALALAASAVAAAPNRPAADLVERKIELVRRLLADTATTGRIESSGNPEAVRAYSLGEQQYQRARTAQAAGDGAAAIAALDSAISALARARSLAPMADGRETAERLRLAERLKGAEELLATYVRHQGARAAPADAGVLAASLAAARADLTAGNDARARAALDRAEREIHEGLARLLGSTTLDYTASFASPHEELDHEMKRYASLADLVPMALAAMAPPPDAVAVVDRHAARAGAQHAAALGRVTDGDAQAAVELMRHAIDEIQLAIAATGLYRLR